MEGWVGRLGQAKDAGAAAIGTKALPSRWPHLLGKTSLVPKAFHLGSLFLGFCRPFSAQCNLHGLGPGLVFDVKSSSSRLGSCSELQRPPLTASGPRAQQYSSTVFRTISACRSEASCLGPRCSARPRQIQCRHQR